MCGIAGFVGPTGVQDAHCAALARRMADAIRHRGPDDGGEWVDASTGIGLGHRRLSVVELSSAGHQPMVSCCGRFVIAFNGEIYNHLELRRELDGYRIPDRENATHAWRGRSDTETLLTGFSCWGVKTTLEKAVGMFAFAVWDREQRVLTLARDRLGEKPLYYGRNNGVLLFGSELSALKAHPAFVGDIDRRAVSLLLRHNYIPAPYSIYSGILKLPPGTFVKFDSEARAVAPAQPEPQAYWLASEMIRDGLEHRFAGDDSEATTALDRLLHEAVQRQMMTDVPLGAFLSGGVDSSLVVALMQAHSSRPVQTFAIGFHEGRYDEATHSKAVARHLGTAHVELYVTPGQAMQVIPTLPQIYDEPFADSSQIPTYLLSVLARQHVTVSLSGDGGDELFCGYDRYVQADRLWRWLHRIPVPLRSNVARALSGVPAGAWNLLLTPMLAVLPRRYRQWNAGDKLLKLSEVLAAGSAETFYREFVSHWRKIESVVIGGADPETALTNAYGASIGTFIEGMMAADTLSYLPDDILVKVDRAAMATSLETRVLYKYLPKVLIERPKMGFGVPLGAWLRGPLRAWAEELLDESRLTQQGYFHPAPIRRRWHEHLSGRRNWAPHLWNVLMFQGWLETERTGNRT